MLVTLKGFGGIWEKRLLNNPAVPDVAARAAYYNTTGVLVDGKLRYRWRVGGKIRFNGGDRPARAALKVEDLEAACEAREQRTPAKRREARQPVGQRYGSAASVRRAIGPEAAA